MNTHTQTPVSGERPNCDFNQAYAWVHALTLDPDNAIFNWRFIHDQDKARPAIKRRGTLAQIWPEATHWNAQGYGVFATVSEMDGSGDKLENVAMTRAHVVDLDNLQAPVNLARAAQHSPAPWFAVQTSPGKAHVYWPLHGAERYRDNEAYRTLQRKFCQFFDGDKAVVDATRVLRVPGFDHCKGERHRVTCYQLPGYGVPVSHGLLVGSMLHVNAPEDGGGRHPLGDPELAAPSADWVRYAIQTMPVDGMSHPDFISFTAAFKQAASTLLEPDEALQLFLQWCEKFGTSSKGRDYNLKHWNSIEDTEVGWKSLLRQNPQLNGAFMFYGVQHQPATSTASTVQTFEQLQDAAFMVTNMDGGKSVISSIMHLTEPEQESILRIIADKTGTSLGSWNRTLKDAMQNTVGSNTDKDHSSIAERVLIEIGRENLIRTGKDFWKYNGTGLWQKVDDAEIRQIVQKVLKAGGHATTQAKTTSIANVLGDMIYIGSHKFNAAPKGTVNCPNGELSFTGGMWFINPHVREHYRTTQIPVPFYYDAPEPTQTLKYLRECFPDDEDAEQKIEMLFALAGYALMDHSDHAKFLVLKGSGRNGKSNWMHILECLVGETNTANVQPSEFNNRFQLGELDNKLLNIVDDLPKKALLPDGVIKAIVSGGKITAEHKGRDPFSVPFRCFLTIGTNYDLPTVDDSIAMMERAVIIEWNRTFSPDERDDTLKHRLVAEELPGILKRALDAYGRALVSGFPRVPSSDQAKEKWLGRINPVRRFVDQEYDFVPGAEVLFQTLWQAFQTWELDERSQRIGRTGFGERLSSIPGVEKRNVAANRNQVTVFGLRRKDSAPVVAGQQPEGIVVSFPMPGQMPPR